jgi:hypothetical protein
MKTRNMITIFAIIALLAGCSEQPTKFQDNTTEPPAASEATQASETAEVEEKPSPEDIAAEKVTADIEKISSENSKPKWNDTSADIASGKYTIVFQRSLPGRSFVKYATGGCINIVEKDKEITIRDDDCLSLLIIKITEEQLQSIMSTKDYTYFIYSFTVNNVDIVDLSARPNRATNEDDDYITVDGMPMYTVIYGKCDKIYEFI